MVRIETSHRPRQPGHADIVTDLDGIFQQQKQPGNEVLHQFLRTEADGDANDPGAGQERRDVDADLLSAVNPTTVTIRHSSAVRSIG